MPEGWGLAEAHEHQIRVVKPARDTSPKVLDHARFRWEVCLLLSLVQGERIARGVDYVLGDGEALPDTELADYSI